MTLLERETQLGSLLQYAGEAGRREGRLVLVSGEAGVGKSSLVEELQARLPDDTWLWGACDGLFTPRPLAPVHDLARQVGGSLGELVSDQAPRDRIFEAMLRLLSDAESLTVLVIEDVQWADEATLDLLRLLGRRLRHVPVLLVVTFRDDALTPNDPLRLALGELAGQRTTRRIDLPPLSASGRAATRRGLDVRPRRPSSADWGQPVLRRGGAPGRQRGHPGVGAGRGAGPRRRRRRARAAHPRGGRARRAPTSTRS